MSQPRFITLSAIGAIAYQGLHDLTADEGKISVDIAFEWIMVEALVRNPGNGRAEGVPGNQKAQRAKADGQRLSRRTYLNGPRVFGFTGIYRPFSRDAGVLTVDDRPGPHADRLLEAWEGDCRVPGYTAGIMGTAGGSLRAEITKACKETLEKGECAVPPTGGLLRKLSDVLAPREAGEGERRVLRNLIASGEHEIRNELSAKLMENLPSADISQRDLTSWLMAGASSPTCCALQAAFDYEEAATALDNCFRRFLAHATNQHGSVISYDDALKAPRLGDIACKIGDLARRAIQSVNGLGDDGLSIEARNVLSPFESRFSSGEFFDCLVERHHVVQLAKHKLSWLDQIEGNWIVRPPYRNQDARLDDAVWTHPMRLVTLANFLRWTL